MAGPWEKYQKSASSQDAQAGPWTKYAQGTPAQPAPEPAGPAAQAGLEHFGNAATLGYLPHLQALIESVTPNPSAEADKKLAEQGITVSEPSYVQMRDQNIARMAEEKAAHPDAALAGSIGGTLVGGAALSSLLPAIQGASYGQRALSAAKAGALVGGAANPGDTPGEVGPQLAERGENAAKSGLLSLLFQPAIEGVSAGIGKASDALKDWAARRAFKAAGPYQRNVLQNSGEIEKIGQAALDNGVITNVPTSYETLSNRASAARESYGEKIAQIVNEIEGQPGVPQLSREDLANRVMEKLRSEPGTPGATAENDKVKQLIDEFRNFGSKEIQVPLLDTNPNLQNVNVQYGKSEIQKIYPQGTKQTIIGGSNAKPIPYNPTQVEVSPIEEVSDEALKYGKPELQNLPGVNPYRDTNIPVSTIEKTGDTHLKYGPASEQSVWPDLGPPDSTPGSYGLGHYGIEIPVSLANKTGTVNNRDALGILEARRLKKSIGDKINWNRLPDADIPLKEQVDRALYSQFQSGEEAIADAVSDNAAVANPDAFKTSKEAYGALKGFQEISGKRADKEFANQFLGLGDKVGGGIGATIGTAVGSWAGMPVQGGLAGTALGVGVNKLGRTYGNQVLAKQGSNLSALLNEISGAGSLAQQNPGFIPAAISNSLRSDPRDEKLDAIVRRYQRGKK